MKRGKRGIILPGIVICCLILLTACGSDHTEENEERFYEAADSLGVSEEDAADYLQRLLSDHVFQNGEMELTGLLVNDIDGNGQKDMMVRVNNAGEEVTYGAGCIYFYMNEEEAYCWYDETLPYFGPWNIIYADLDNDGNVEIAFEMQGMGCGAAGDWYPVVLKYRNGVMEKMELPTDRKPEDCLGVVIEITQEPFEDTYSAYCAYLDETIQFSAPNIKNNEHFKVPEAATLVGGSVRGFYNLRCIEYEGGNALQVSQYLCGEGGTMHFIGTTEFIITWDENENSHIAKWWIEPDRLFDEEINY